MALYFYFNETTGDLVYSDQATYSGDGYTSLGEQTNVSPASPSYWIFSSKSAYIKTVTKDPNISTQIDILNKMSYMFQSCIALTSLDLSGFDTSNVTSMVSMFNNCEALTSLDLGSFDTSNVTSMSAMFRDCNVLASLDLGNFDTSNVTSMNNMFNGCSALASLDLGSFDTSNVTSMTSMFQDCNVLTSLDLGSFDTSNVTSMGYMFYGCSALTSLDLGNFDTSNVTSMNEMFKGCGALTSLDLGNFDTSNVTGMRDMFSGCGSLRIIDISPNMSNFLSRLPADTYYDAVTRQSYAKASIPGGSTYVRDLNDLDLVATMVQTRMGINVAKRLARRALDKAGSIDVGGGSVDVVRTDTHSTSYTKDTLEIVTDSTGKVTEMYFISA